MNPIALAITAAMLLFALNPAAQAAPIFPNIGASTGGPAVIITFTDAGPTITNVSSQTYDGADDVVVGLINSSSVTQTKIVLSGTGNGGGLFAFDGDGIINYTDSNTGQFAIGNPADPSGYAGPGITFSNISADAATGEVDFVLAPGDSAYFGLESSPSSINNGQGITLVGTPEPGSMLVALLGLAGLGMRRVSRR